MSKLFTPIQLGSIQLQHRIAMAPLTRFRADKDHVHHDIAAEYYAQRASTPGTLLITEATFIRPEAGGYDNVPGIWNEDQVKAWKKIVDVVHAKGSFVYLQLWAIGRAAIADQLAPYPVVSASDIPLDPHGDTRSKDKPRPLTVEEIKQYSVWYAEAAKRFVEEAGGDGVEVHGANGYLIDQFTQTNSNKRTDQYGGSVENRTRFALEVMEAVTKAVGQEKTGIRLSPHSHFQDMKMDEPELRNTFSYLTNALKKEFPHLAYIHVTEPRVSGGFDTKADRLKEEESIDFIHKIWEPKPIIVAGQYIPESAVAETEKYPNAIVAFGRHFIANPDLVLRIKLGIPLHKYDRSTFYKNGPDHPEGYTDQPFATPEEIEKAKKASGGKL